MYEKKKRIACIEAKWTDEFVFDVPYILSVELLHRSDVSYGDVACDGI